MVIKQGERPTRAASEFDSKAVSEISGSVLKIPISKTIFKTVNVTKPHIKMQHGAIRKIPTTTQVFLKHYQTKG